MNSPPAIGVALTLVGLGRHVVGLGVLYPGRAFSLTALILGLTVLAVSRSDHPDAEQ